MRLPQVLGALIAVIALFPAVATAQQVPIDPPEPWPRQSCSDCW
jgi:hypothetical protein